MGMTEVKPPTASEIARAQAIVAAAGLTSEPSGWCLRCWYQEGVRRRGERFVDVAGLLAADDGAKYVRDCYAWGAAL